MLSAFACRGRSPFAALALLALTGCVHKTEITVRDPQRVGVSVRDERGALVELPGDGAPGRVDAVLPPPSGLAFGGPRQPLALVREDTGELHYEAPETAGHEQGILVGADGRVTVPSSYLGADDAYVGSRDAFMGLVQSARSAGGFIAQEFGR